MFESDNAALIMSSLKLFLLGPPRIERDETLLDIERRKAIALLIYLAVTGEGQRRDTLATLLWPNVDQSRARGALRRDLSVLNKALGQQWLVIDRETVSLSRDPEFWLDVDQFHLNLEACQTHNHPADEVCPACLPLLTEAVALYRDDFLTGFTLRDSPDFDEWQFFQTESLRQVLATTLERLVRGYIALEDFDVAIPPARRRLALDPLHEPAHRQLMQLYAWTGQQAAAGRQYQICVEILAEELGVTPDPETTALYEHIRQGAAASTAGPAKAQPVMETLTPDETSRPAIDDRLSPSSPAQPATAENIGPTATPPVPGVDEIRIVTVLYVALTQPAETDETLPLEEAALLMNRLLQAMESVLTKYEAQVENVLGTTILAIFGTLQSHEDDPERAVRAALEIQRSAQALGLELTIGISTGEVYFGQIGSDVHHEPIVMGPAVTLAKRLHSESEAGTILVGELTYRRTRRAFKYKSLSLAAGDDGPQTKAYRVIRLHPQPDKVRGIEGLQSILIGRDEELAKLKAALLAARQGQGQLVSLIGEAGVGKSRLVTELKRAALQSPTSNLIWLEGRCLEMGATASYWPFVDLFRGYFAWGPRDGKRIRARHLIDALREMKQQGNLSTEQFEEMGPLLGNLLSLHFGNSWDNQLKDVDPEQIRHRTFAAIHDFFVALARRRPVVLVFEDMHWADSLSLDLISLLMEALPSASLLLLCVYRPERHYKSWRLATIASRKCPENYAELHLGELTPQQSRQLVDALLTIEEATLPVKALILEKSQGNPFFLEEMLRSLLDAGMIYQAGKVWRVREGIETDIVPESVQSIILSRVDLLDPELKQVLQSAAVIGRLFQQQILTRILPAEVDLEHALWLLEDHALIYQERIMPEEEYAFKQILTQKTVYHMIPRQRRTLLHRQVAQAMEQHYHGRLDRHFERIAYHYDRSDDLDKAVDYLLAAGDKARRAYLNNEAIGYFQRVLDRLDAVKVNDSDRRVIALKGLGQVFVGTGQLAEAEKYFQQAQDLDRKT